MALAPQTPSTLVFILTTGPEWMEPGAGSGAIQTCELKSAKSDIRSHQRKGSRLTQLVCLSASCVLLLGQRLQGLPFLEHGAVFSALGLSRISSYAWNTFWFCINLSVDKGCSRALAAVNATAASWICKNLFKTLRPVLKCPQKGNCQRQWWYCFLVFKMWCCFLYRPLLSYIPTNLTQRL